MFIQSSSTLFFIAVKDHVHHRLPFPVEQPFDPCPELLRGNMLLVGADDDRDAGEGGSDRATVLLQEGAEGLDAIGEMDGAGPELRQRSDALKQLVRTGERGTAGAIDDPDEVQRLIRRMLFERSTPFSPVRETAPPKISAGPGLRSKWPRSRCVP
jgi:hypothetical protein